MKNSHSQEKRNRGNFPESRAKSKKMEHLRNQNRKSNNQITLSEFQRKRSGTKKKEPIKNNLIEVCRTERYTFPD